MAGTIPNPAPHPPPANPPVAPALPELIGLPGGAVLSEMQAQSMAMDRPVRLVVTAGAVDCGKTTLLSIVYELFQTGPVSPILFAGCDTFPAFEQRCHLSRADSENDEAQTSRTPYDGPHPEYIHLKIQDGVDSDVHTDFLFTDVSGEMFEYARNSTDECKRLTFLLRAAHLVVFLDCEKAMQPGKRWGMVQDAKSLLQSCLDSEMLSPACFVTVVWAKCDFFEAAKDKPAVEAFVTGVQEDFQTTFGNRIPNFKFHRCAARPTRFPNMKMGFGVRELLSDWIKKSPQGKPLQLEPPTDNGGTREIEQFAKRHNAQQVNP
ncbi:MAG: hypothetical protein P4N60_06755 [Verrucomicrobiae bacterium]|nr:hypothetical protein [Verrucomicrobiae bacterium]